VRHISAGVVTTDESGSNLSPVVEFLESRGNRSASGGFRDSQGGFYCKMTEPLDFAAITKEFDFDDRIRVSPEGDEILDTTSGASLYGRRYAEALRAERFGTDD
jgi:hypothetical protein